MLSRKYKEILAKMPPPPTEGGKDGAPAGGSPNEVPPAKDKHSEDEAGFNPGGEESFAAGCARLVERACRFNVDVEFRYGESMPHTYAMDYKLYPEAAHAMDQIVRFVNYRLEMVEEC